MTGKGPGSQALFPYRDSEGSLLKISLDDGGSLRHHLLTLGVHFVQLQVVAVQNQDIGIAVRLQAALAGIEVQGLGHH